MGVCAESRSWAEAGGSVKEITESIDLGIRVADLDDCRHYA